MIIFSTIDDSKVNKDKSGFLSHFDGRFKEDSILTFSKIILKKHIGMGIFKENKRCLDNFVGSSLIAYDFDDGKISSQEVKDILDSHSLKYVIAGSKNHLKDKNDGKGIIERFHVILFLDVPIKISDYYKFYIKTLKVFLGFKTADKNCVDATRYYFKHSSILFLNETGHDLCSKKYEETYKEYEQIRLIDNMRLLQEVGNITDIPSDDLDFLLKKTIEKLGDSISGNNGDSTLFAAACKIINMGGRYADLMEYNSTKCYPRWKDKDLQRKWAAANKVAHQKPISYLKKVIRNLKKEGV